MVMFLQDLLSIKTSHEIKFPTPSSAKKDLNRKKGGAPQMGSASFFVAYRFGIWIRYAPNEWVQFTIENWTHAI